MKKMLFLAVLLSLVPAFASAATCTNGTYSGTVTSVSSDINGKPVTMTATQKGNACELTSDIAGSKEVWTWTDTTLTQKELNKDGTVALQYGATKNGDKYTINCKENACDGGVNKDTYWKLNATADAITYEVYGHQVKDDAASPIVKRHTYSVKMNAK